MEINSNVNTLKYMYRYLMKYVGTYRVKAEYDTNKNDFPRNEHGQIEDSFEDLYIPCSKGIIKHTYVGDDILVICFYDKLKTAINVYDVIKKKYPNLNIEFEQAGSDGLIYFDAHDLKKIAPIIKPRTSGAKINPFAASNLPKPEYKIPASDLAELYHITADLTRVQTMHFFKQVNSDFVKTLPKELKQDFKLTRLSAREYFHSKGLWEKYLKYVTKKYNKYLKTLA